MEYAREYLKVVLSLRQLYGLYGLIHSNFWRPHPKTYATCSNAVHSKYNLITLSQAELK